METLLVARRDEVLRLAARHGANHVRGVGSVARPEASEESDIDFLVDWKRIYSPKQTPHYVIVEE